MLAFVDTVDPMSYCFDWRLLFRLERKAAALPLTSVHHSSKISSR